jgi:Raf kinase inhibitor-like YbhB/YbcL family protein
MLGSSQLFVPGDRVLSGARWWTRRTLRTGAVGLLGLLACSGSFACVSQAAEAEAEPDPKVVPLPEEDEMQIESPAFTDHQPIPRQYTCEGEDVAPPLRWSNLPEATRSLALIVDDPDAPDPKNPQRTWVHWVVYAIPPTAEGLPEGGALPSGARAGKNDWGRADYGGPCPPIGEHRYFFKLYALDRPLGQLGQPTKAELEEAMIGHVLAEAQLVGTYEKHE